MRGGLLGFLAISTLQIEEVCGLGKLWGDLKPTSFNQGDPVDIHVGQLWTLVVGVIPYDFYSLKWCDSTEGHMYDESKLKEKKPKNNHKVNDYGVNDNIHESPYQYTVGEDQDAIIACNRILSLEEKKQFKEMIGERYRY